MNTAENKQVEIVDHEQKALQTVTPLDMLNHAIERGLDPESLQKFMDLHDRWEAKQAKSAFDKALAAFKADPPKVIHDKKNTQYGSTYSSLANTVNTVNAALAQHGLSATWEIDQGDTIKVTCVLAHVDGFEKRVPMSGPADESGKKNDLQKIRSTITYLRATTFEAVTGIATHEANKDDDGNSAGDKIDEHQAKTIKGLLQSTESNVPAFLKWLATDCVENIEPKDYKRAIDMLEKKARKTREPGSDDE